MQGQPHAFFDRFPFALRQSNQLQLRSQLDFRYGPPVGAFHKVADHGSGTLRVVFTGRVSADENLFIARRRLRTRIVRADDFEIIDEQAAAHVGIEILARVFEVREFGKRGPQEMFAGLDPRAGYKFAARIPEGTVALNYFGNDRLAIHREDELARRRGLAGGFFAGL